jgi:thiamine biosynthesis lipoprotein
MFILLIPSLCGCEHFKNPNEDYCVLGNDGVYLCSKDYIGYFDTNFNLKFYMTKSDTYDIKSIFDNVENTLSEYNQLLDKYHEYAGVTNVYSINHRLTDTVIIPEKLYHAIDFALIHEKDATVNDELLFNIALGPVLDIWHDARENSECDTSTSNYYLVCPIPRAFIDGIDFPTNPDNIILNQNDYSISFLEESMEIDLGGYGKGYVSEIITDMLDSQGIKYLLNAGNSNVKAGGINPNNTDGLYYIALTTPTIEDSYLASYFAYIKVPGNMAVVTSGSNQRFFIGSEDGNIYHHIIDPRTNYPGGEALSITILYEDGAIADIYSTSIFLMTVSEGLSFVEGIDGLEAVWYLSDSTKVSSSGFENYLYKFT